MDDKDHRSSKIRVVEQRLAAPGKSRRGSRGRDHRLPDLCIRTFSCLLILLAFAAVWQTLGALEPTVVASSYPQRIISTAPSITETIFALGAGDRLVGVTTFCDYPPEARNISKIGDFASPNVEVMLGLSPDLVIILKNRGDLRDRLRAVSMPLFEVRQEDLSSILESIQMLAERIGERRNGELLTIEIQEQISSVQKRVDRKPVRPRVLALIGRNQGSLTDIYAVGPNSFLGELIRLAGGSNVFADTSAQYPKVSIEAILFRKPDIIIDLSYGQFDRLKESAALQLWKKFPTLPAVESNQVFVTSNDIFLLPGPRVGEAVKELAEMIHGIQF